MDERELVPFGPDRLPLDGGPRVEVEVSRATAEHLVAWDVDQRVKAVHEAGHAVAAAVLGIPIKAVDISDRDGGHTEYGLSDDSHPVAMPDGRVLDLIVVALAAMAAERAILGQATTGCSHDLEQATQLAYERFEAGLDPAAPFIHPAGMPFNLVSSILVAQLHRAAVATLGRCRARSEALVEQHQTAILSFATTLYRERRLAGATLDDALRVAGIVRHDPAAHASA